MGTKLIRSTEGRGNFFEYCYKIIREHLTGFDRLKSGYVCQRMSQSCHTQEVFRQVDFLSLFQFENMF